MSRNKTAGPDEIVIEMLSALDDFRIDKNTEIIKEIYDTGEIPENRTQSNLIAILKKAGAKEGGFHRPVSLICQITLELIQ